MKTKLIFTTIALFSAILFVHAEKVFIDGLYYYLDATTQTAEVTSEHYHDYDNYSYVSGEVTIPETVIYNGTTYSVTSIGESTFMRCYNLTSVTIPNSVTSIGDYAFMACYNLTSVTIPNSVTSIGDGTFYDCSSLTSITIPNSVTSIDEGAFAYCSSLTSITIPNSVTSIENNAFDLVPNIEYHGTATSYNNWGARSMNGFVDGYMVYSDNSKTTLLACSSAVTGEINIPNSVTTIENYAFWECRSLTSITISNSVTTIGYRTFWECISLTNVIIPNSVTSIGEETFYNCSSLTTVTIPNSVTSIGDESFSYCSSLTSITIPNSVTSIGDNAFLECNSLRSITIPNSVTSIGEGVFAYCDKLSSVSLQDGLKSIGSYMFANCTSLTDVIIPISVESVGGHAFENCTSLKSFTLTKEHHIREWYVSIFSGCNIKLNIDCPILKQMFRGEDGIVEVNIGENVPNIPSYAFSSCWNLKKVTIGNNVQIIDDNAFSTCKNLETIFMGKSVRKLNAGAFSWCDNLTDIYMYCQRVPTADDSGNDNIFYESNHSFYVWVPQNLFDDYLYHSFWGSYIIKPMTAESVNTDQVVVTPDYNSADVVWPSESNADTYELIIKDKDGKEICSLIFNSNGQLQSIAFRAPAVDSEHAPQQTQASGFRFTVTGLDSGSQYSYTITAKDAAGKTLQTHSGSFYTLSTTGVDNLNQDGGTSAVRKVIEDGQVKIIMSDGRKLNMQGAEVK